MARFGEYRAQVSDNLKPPIWITLGALELLSVDIGRVAERVVVGEQRLAPTLDLDRMRRSAVGGCAQQIAAGLVLRVLAELRSRRPATRQLGGAHDLDG